MVMQRQLRESCPRRLLINRCAHSAIVDAARWGDDVRLSDLEPKFNCKACDRRGADVRPPFERTRMGTGSPGGNLRAVVPARGWRAGTHCITHALISKRAYCKSNLGAIIASACKPCVLICQGKLSDNAVLRP